MNKDFKLYDNKLSNPELIYPSKPCQLKAMDNKTQHNTKQNPSVAYVFVLKNLNS